jgi:hypothetical protein
MRRAQAPVVATVDSATGPRRIEIRDRSDAKLLRALVDAQGNWIDASHAGMSPSTASKHAGALRRLHSLPIETDAIRSGSSFFNRHRLLAAVTITGGPDD